MSARDVRDYRLDQPASDHALATVEAATSALHRVTAELMAPAGTDAERARLCAELESIFEALTAVAEQNQRAVRHNAELAALLDSAREEAENRERALMEQQDGVLEALLTEHERQTQALEHELEAQIRYGAALRRELDQKAALVETLTEKQRAPPRHAPTPRTWPPNDAADEPPDASPCHAPAPGQASVGRLVADRDHLLASLKLLKRQRDDAQQETLDLVEQLAAANNEIEALRGQLPSISAPPVPSFRRAETTEPPPAPGAARECALKARLASTQPPPASALARATPTNRTSRAPTLPPAETLPTPEQYCTQDTSAAAITTLSEDAPSRSEPLRTPPPAPRPPAPPFRTITRPGPAGYSSNPEPLPTAPVDVSRPPTSSGDATRRSEAETPLSERKPPLKRKPDPTQSPLGTYSLTAPAASESLHPLGRGTVRPSGGRRR